MKIEVDKITIRSLEGGEPLETYLRAPLPSLKSPPSFCCWICGSKLFWISLAFEAKATL